MGQSFIHIDVIKSLRKNIVKVTDGNSFGTGFFIQKEYCVTCHHVIYKMNEIKVEYNNHNYYAEWVKEFSDMKKDIAVLKVKGCNAKPLSCSRQALPQLKVCGFGYLKSLIGNIPQAQITGELQYSGDTTKFPAEKVIMEKKNEWNKKPKVKVECYQLNCNIAGPGISGSPILYSVNWLVIGMFIAHPSGYNIGYVIPIELILEKFQQEKRVELPSSTIDTASFIKIGNEYISQRKYKDAIENYDTVLKDANYLNALHNKAYALHELKKYREAISCLEKAIEINPNHVDAWYNKGLFLRDLGQKRHMEEELKCYEKVIEINPNYPYAWNNKGVLLANSGNYKQALKCFDRFIEIDPSYANGWNNKAICLSKLGNIKKALKCCEKSIELDRHYPNPLYTKSAILHNLGKHEDAKVCLIRAKQLERKNINIKKKNGYPVRKRNEKSKTA